MIIRKGDIFKQYTKIDNHVTTNKNISNGAYRLYAYYSGLKHGDNFVDNYIIKALGITKQVLTKRKRELKDEELILTDQLASRIYVLYIGNSKMSARTVKSRYEAEERERAALDGE